MQGEKNVFFIRNFFCILSAESIIAQYKIKNPIACIINRDGNKKLVEYIKLTLHTQLWSEIKILDVSKRKTKLLSHQTKQDLANIKEVIQTNLTLLKPDSIFITVINDSIEKCAYYYAVKHSIKINKYEEGLNHYANSKILDPYSSSKLKRFLRLIRYPNHRYVLLSEEYCKYDYVYSVFPEFYKKQDFRNQMFPLDLEAFSAKIQRDCSDSVLILTGPYSDDGGMSEGEEFGYYRKFFDTVPGGCRRIIKPHPRENQEKLQRLCKEFDCEFVDDDYMNLPAEFLIRDCKFKYVIGFWSSTLLYASNISKKTHIISFVKTLKSKYTFLENEYEMFIKQNIECI